MSQRDHEKDEPGPPVDSQNGSAPTTALGPLLQAAKLPKPSSPGRAKSAKAGAQLGAPAGGGASRAVRGLSPEDREQEKAARKRVAALVSGGIHFKLKREGNHVQATRGSAPAKLCARLASKTYVPELTLDVRTQAGAEVRDSIASFLRLVHRRGVRQLLISVDDGTAPEQEREQRREDVIAALTQGAAAPLVRAFTTAHENLGGTKGLAVLLI
jgi:DNA-nicking Smr family endonuclease